jgi:hypothetical protein
MLAIRLGPGAVDRRLQRLRVFGKLATVAEAPTRKSA